MLKIKIVILLLSFSEITSAQMLKIPNEGINLQFEIKSIDSNYFIIPKLTIKQSKTIQIHKKLFYGREIDRLTDFRVYFQKLINGVYLNVYFDATSEPPSFDNDFLKFRTFTSTDVLKDTINLKNLIPLEPGKYKIMLSLNYRFKGFSSTVFSDYYEFESKFMPKHSIFTSYPNDTSKNGK